MSLNKYTTAFLIELDKEYMGLRERHTKAAPRPGTIPIGGGDWMDTFFRMEGVAGILSAVRRGKSIREGLEEGKQDSRRAVLIWNERRGKKDYQTHRWEQTAFDYLDSLVTRLLRQVYGEKLYEMLYVKYAGDKPTSDKSEPSP
jgi:hypothetical protein